MLEIFIKYLALIYCSYYIFIKLLNVKSTKRECAYFVVFLIISLPAIYFLRQYAESLSVVFLVILFVFFCFKVIMVNLSLSITTSVISFGIAYFIYLVAAVISICPIHIFYSLQNIDESHLPWYTVIPTCVIQVLLCRIPFRFKRLKNGMPYLIKHGSSEIGVYVSFSLLMAISFLGMDRADNYIKLIPIVFVFISGVVILFWWRTSLTKKYLEKKKIQELQELQKIIDNQNTDIANLRAHNDELSKIIHKDNKLIPALEYAVRQYLLTADNECDRYSRIEKAKVLLSQIEESSRERRGIISSYELNSKTLPSTNVASIDSLLLYLLQKSKNYQVDFNITITGSVKYLVENLIEELDANILLADLIENAFIATKKCSLKNVMVHIGISNEHYSIDVFDNGIPFSPEIIARIGLSRVTTHENDGGTGIGLMTTFEILKKYQASFEIEEIQDGSLFTKRVTVCFNSLGQFQIKTGCDNKTENINDREYV